MNFNYKRYPSIENSYQDKHMDYIRSRGFGMSNEVWCVTEKIHGSNLAIYTNAGGCQTASRNNMLQDKEADTFFNFGQIKEEVYSDCGRIFANISNNVDVGIHNIIVYGELFGGAYNHPDVPRNNKVSSVQKGVFYSPNIHFSVFDIVILFDDGREEFLNYVVVQNICKELNIPYQDVMFYGTLDDCLEYPNDELSRIPDMLGLPPIEDNIMEGVVIKPIAPKFLACGSRVILKNRNDKFKEKASAGKKKKQHVDVPEHVLSVIEDVALYITENRLDSVESKVGELTQKRIGQYIKEFTHDVFEDANKDGVFNTLDKGDMKHVNKFVSGECKKLIFKRL